MNANYKWRNNNVRRCRNYPKKKKNHPKLGDLGQIAQVWRCLGQTHANLSAKIVDFVNVKILL
jgi:hypothetical protein